MNNPIWLVVVAVVTMMLMLRGLTRPSLNLAAIRLKIDH